MKHAVSIAVAQTCPVGGDVAANIRQHVQLASAAASEGAMAVVFPELSLTGYELNLARDLAFSIDDPRLRPLVEVVAEHSIILMPGAPVKVDQKLHIGTLILRPDQRTLLYTKQRLGAFSAGAAVDGAIPPPEDEAFAPGDHNPHLDIGGTSAAVAICADIGTPSHPERAAERGAAAYLASMFIIPSEFDGDEAKLVAYARTYSILVAMANYGAPTGGLAAAGRSSIWSEGGELLVRLPSAGPGVGIATRLTRDWRCKVVMLPIQEAASSW